MRELLSLSVRAFSNELAADSPAPGGGSAAALAGALGAGLGTMVAGLTYGKKDWEQLAPDAQQAFRDAHAALSVLRSALEVQVEADTAAFDAFLAARRLPKETNTDKAARGAAMAEAAERILAVPLQTAEQCLEVLCHLEIIATAGNRNALSDAGTGAALAMAGLEGALLNVRINLSGVSDPERRVMLAEQAERMALEGGARKERVMVTVRERMAE